MNRLFTCNGCGETFLSLLSDDEAEEEYKRAGFSPLPYEATVLVCDDCYEEAMKRYASSN